MANTKDDQRQPKVGTSAVVCDEQPQDMSALKGRLRWWLKGWLRAYQTQPLGKKMAKAAIRGQLAVERSQRLVP